MSEPVAYLDTLLGHVVEARAVDFDSPGDHPVRVMLPTAGGGHYEDDMERAQFDARFVPLVEQPPTAADFLPPGWLVSELRKADVEMRGVLERFEAARSRAAVLGPPAKFEPRNDLLTDAEHDLIDALGRCNSAFAAVVGDGPNSDEDRREFRTHVHACQQQVMSQAACRAYPDLYRLLGHTMKEGEA